MSSISGFIIGGSGPVNGILTITGNNAIAVPGDGARNIDIVGSNLIDIEGNAGTNTLEVSVVGGDDAQVIMGRGGTGDLPIFATIVSGDGTVTATRDGNTLDLRASAAAGLTQLQGNSGIPAVPAMGVINVIGSTNITTESSTPNSDDLSIFLNDFISWPETTSSVTGLIELNGERFMHAFGGSAGNNTFLGPLAGNFSMGVTAVDNTGIGSEALSSLTSGDSNVALGSGAGANLQTGSDNVILGMEAALNGTILESNVIIGFNAAQNIGPAGGNIILGSFSADNLTGGDSDNIIIGSLGVVGDNNTIRIGTQGVGPAQQNAAFMAGIHNTAYGPSGRVVQIGSDGKLGSSTGSNGQILISGNIQPEWANITPSNLIDVTNGSNSIEVALEEATDDGQIIIGKNGDISEYGILDSSDNSILIDPDVATPGSYSINLRVNQGALGRGAFRATQNFNAPNVMGTQTNLSYLMGSGGSAALTVNYDPASAFFAGDGAGNECTYTAPVDGVYEFIWSCDLLNINSPIAFSASQIDPGQGALLRKEFIVNGGTIIYQYFLNATGDMGPNSGVSQVVLRRTTTPSNSDPSGYTNFMRSMQCELSSGDVVTFRLRTARFGGLPNNFADAIGVGRVGTNATSISGYLVTPL